MDDILGGPEGLWARCEQGDLEGLRRAVELLPQLARAPGPHLRGEDWARWRERATGCWLRVWQQIGQQLEPGFDPADVPELNVPPPEETGLPAGVAPEAIAAAGPRARYEAALARHREQVRRYSRQHALRLLREQLWPQLERYVLTAHASPPFEPARLRQQLEAWLTAPDDAPRGQRLLEALRGD